MTLVFTLDDENGMLFNSRRQTRDVVMRHSLMALVQKGNGRIWMSKYSSKLFGPEINGSTVLLLEENDFEKDAKENDCVFVEDVDVPVLPEDTLVIYRWNTIYPSDKRFTVDLSKYDAICSWDFEGKSHPAITCTIYRHLERRVLRDEKDS